MTGQPVADENHHFLPRFYLRGFTDAESWLWVYEHGSPAPRQSKPKHEGHRLNYYVMPEMADPNLAEKMFARLESSVAPTVRKLGNPQFNMTDQQRSDLYMFVALAWSRVPSFREFVDRDYGNFMKERMRERAEDADAFYADLKEVEAKTGEPVGNHEDLRQFVLSGKFDLIQGSNGFNLKYVLKLGLMLAETLEGEYDHNLLYAPKGAYFITGDTPVFTIEPDGHGKASLKTGFNRPGTEVLMPLSRRVCLHLRRRGRYAKLEVSEEKVAEINDLTMACAQKNIYGPVGTRRLARIFNERGCKI